MISSSGVQPIGSLTISNVGKRSVSYIFTASPTSGASYEVTFMHQRSGIPQAGTARPPRAGINNKAGLIPDVTYTLQVIAVLSGVRSTPVSKDFTTQPDGETAMTAVYVCAYSLSTCSARHFEFTAKIHHSLNVNDYLKCYMYLVVSDEASPVIMCA